jgi:hypothetical protein
MSQISRLRDQSGPMSDSLVARSTSTDCGIAQLFPLLDRRKSRRRRNPRRRVPLLRVCLAGAFPVGQRKRARTKKKLRDFLGSNRLVCPVSVRGPHARDTGMTRFSKIGFGWFQQGLSSPREICCWNTVTRIGEVADWLIHWPLRTD